MPDEENIDSVVVDPIDQLAFSLHWEEEYSLEYQRKVLTEAVWFILENTNART